MSIKPVAVDVNPKRGVMLQLDLDFTYHTDTLDCLISFSFFPLTEAQVQYESALKLCTIQSANL